MAKNKNKKASKKTSNKKDNKKVKNKKGSKNKVMSFGSGIKENKGGFPVHKERTYKAKVASLTYDTSSKGYPMFRVTYKCVEKDYKSITLHEFPSLWNDKATNLPSENAAGQIKNRLMHIFNLDNDDFDKLGEFNISEMSNVIGKYMKKLAKSKKGLKRVVYVKIVNQLKDGSKTEQQSQVQALVSEEDYETALSEEFEFED